MNTSINTDQPVEQGPCDQSTRLAISRFLFVSDPPEAVDLAFVLGSPSISSVYPAVELYLAGLTRRLLISGATITANLEAEWKLYQSYALAKGVLPEDILIEPSATNTRENLLLGSALVEKSIGWNNVNVVALCAKPFHMRRVLMGARGIFPAHVRLVALPPKDPGDIQADNWWTFSYGSERVLQELGRISAYGLLGHLGDL